MVLITAWEIDRTCEDFSQNFRKTSMVLNAANPSYSRVTCDGPLQSGIFDSKGVSQNVNVAIAHTKYDLFDSS